MVLEPAPARAKRTNSELRKARDAALPFERVMEDSAPYPRQAPNQFNEAVRSIAEMHSRHWRD